MWIAIIQNKKGVISEPAADLNPNRRSPGIEERPANGG
jgi:hypothetical protein